MPCYFRSQQIRSPQKGGTTVLDNQQVYGLYEDYLRNEKKASANTLSSYLRDIRQLGEYLDSHTDEQYVTATEEDLSGYIAYLRSNGKSVATVSRAIAS